MTEAFLQQETPVATDARAEHGHVQPPHGVASGPVGRILQTCLQRVPSGYASFPAFCTSSAEHSAQSNKWSHVLSIPPERFDIADRTASPLLLHIYIPQETWTIPRISIYTDSEPDYLAVELANPGRQGWTSLANLNNAGERCSRPVKAKSFWTEAEREYRRLRDDLVCVLEDIPIEDGMQHPADELIERALGSSISRCMEALTRAFGEFCTSRPAMSAAILRCVARVEFAQSGAQGLALAQHALNHDDVELREAAVRAFEAWGGVEALGFLRQHDDPEAWLQEYVRRVVEDLSDATS